MDAKLMNLIEFGNLIRDKWAEIVKEENNGKGTAKANTIFKVLGIQSNSIEHKCLRANLDLLPNTPIKKISGRAKEYELISMNEIYPVNVLGLIVPVKVKKGSIIPNTSHSVHLTFRERLMCENCTRYNSKSQICSFRNMTKHPKCPACREINVKKLEKIKQS